MADLVHKQMGLMQMKWYGEAGSAKPECCILTVDWLFTNYDYGLEVFLLVMDLLSGALTSHVQ